VNLEQSTIGLCLIDKDNLEIAVENKLKPECFANEKNAKIFSAMLEARSKKITVDSVYLFSKLGSEYAPIIADVSANAPIQQNVEFYVKELIDAYWAKTSADRLRELYIKIKGRQQFSEISALMADVEATTKEITSADVCDDSISIKAFAVAEALAVELDQKIDNKNKIEQPISRFLIQGAE